MRSRSEPRRLACLERLPRRHVSRALQKQERKKNIEDNFRAADEAAALEADSLVMVVGGCAGDRAR